MMKIIQKIGSCLVIGLKFMQEHFKATLLAVFIFWLFLPTGEESIKAHNLEEITLNGPIFDATEIVKKLDKARENDDIKGVLLSIDSPGGAVAPSVEIAYAIKRLRDEKPVIVYAAGIMASGGYYSGIWGNEIIANPGSMIGSIGVIIEGADISELMQKIGVKTQIANAGTYKQVGTFDRQWSRSERGELEKVIQGTYTMFVNDVAQARHLQLARVNEFADAHIFTAAQAKNVGLIDTIGVKFDAKNRLQKLANVKDPVWNEESPMDEFLNSFATKSSSMLHTYFPTISLR